VQAKEEGETKGKRAGGRRSPKRGKECSGAKLTAENVTNWRVWERARACSPGERGWGKTGGQVQESRKEKVAFRHHDEQAKVNNKNDYFASLGKRSLGRGTKEEKKKKTKRGSSSLKEP